MKGLVHLIEDACAWAWNRKRDSKGSATPIPQSAFLLGTDIEEGTPVFLTPRDLARHAYITGATGSGKTNTLLRLVDYLAASKETVCLLDLRGDLVDLVVSRFAASGQDLTDRVRIIDLRDMRFIPALNPLEGRGSVHGRAYGVLEALRGKAESWGVQIDEVLRNCLIALASSGGSLVDLPQLLSSSAKRQQVLRNLADPIAIEFFERFAEMSADRRQSLASPVLNKVTPFLAIPELRKLFAAKSGFDLAAHLNTPGSIVLIALAGHQLKEAARLAGSLLLTIIENFVVSRADNPANDRIPIHLIVDEFENFVSAPFLTLLAEGRRYGGRLILAHQNLSQLPRETQEALRINAHLQLYFQTGAIDAAVLAKEVSGFGKKDKVVELLRSLRVGSAVFSARPQHGRTIAIPLTATAFADRNKTEQLVDASVRAYEVSNQGSVASTPVVERRVRHARMPKL